MAKKKKVKRKKAKVEVLETRKINARSANNVNLGEISVPSKTRVSMPAIGISSDGKVEKPKFMRKVKRKKKKK